MDGAAGGGGLLGAGDPAPVMLRPEGDFPALIVCEHAGRAIPAALGDLGLPAEERARHIGWDIGALGVAEALAERLGAPLVAQRYSRLVIDCNRPEGSASLMPEASDGTPVPGNVGADPAPRMAAIHAPFHAAVAALLDARPRAVIALHSFTPMLRARPAPRPWHAGFLSRRDRRTGAALIAAMRGEGLILAENQPYQIEDDTDETIPRHAEARALPHSLIEIRQDLISGPKGQAEWAARLATALQTVLRQA